MKTIRVVSAAGAALIWAVGIFFSSIFISQAQVQAQPDSAVQIAAESQGLQLVPPEQIPECGTFWIVSDSKPTAPLPFLPSEYDPASTPVFSLGTNGQFLVDATGGAVPQPTGRQALLGISSSALLQAQADMVLDLIAQIQESQTNAELDDLESGVSFQAQVFTTNQLWFSIAMTNNTGTGWTVVP